MKTLYTFFDILTGLLLKQAEKLPTWLKLFLLPFIITPALLLAMLADQAGKRAEDVT